jgi:hypothetical protein
VNIVAVVDGCNNSNNSKKVCLGGMHHAQTSLSICEPSDATAISYVSSDDEEVPNQSVGIATAYSTFISIEGLECGESSKGRN